MARHRWVSLAAALLLAGAGTAPAAAIEPPTIPAGDAEPPDPPPGPGQPMRAAERPCNLPGVLPAPPATDIPPSLALLDIEQAHRFSVGDGVRVAVIDTGVAPNPRLPRLEGGGDYVADTDGLVDCDMHGTLVAGLIGAQRGPNDQVVGVAPGSTLISIRQSSQNYSPEHPVTGAGLTMAQAETVERLDAMANAIVHAANMGARVINMSVHACIPAAHPLDQTHLAAAVRYAAVVKDVVLVAAAGNLVGDSECQANPGYDPLTPDDPRNWAHVVSVSTPSWFSDYVISVGAVDNAGAAPNKSNAAQFSMPGPWLDIAAPGTDVISVGPDGAAVNALPGRDGLVSVFGTSFSAAYVCGVAALVRSRFPGLSAAQVRARLIDTAHAPPRGVDNSVGHGLVDPVAALTYELDTPTRDIAEGHREVLVVPPAPPPPDLRAHRLSWAIAGVAAAAVIAAAAVATTRKGSK